MEQLFTSWMGEAHLTLSQLNEWFVGAMRTLIYQFDSVTGCIIYAKNSLYERQASDGSSNVVLSFCQGPLPRR